MILPVFAIFWPGSVFGKSQESNNKIIDSIEEFEPIVVTGTVSPVSLSQSIANATVIDMEQIDASQASSVAELLRQVPGLHIDQPGGRGGVSSVYIRGGDPNYTVVLIDGVKVNDPNNSRGGSFDFSTLNTDNIEKIEIVRGPLSAVYGSDAMSGVINIITRKGSQKPAVDVEASGGGFGYARTFVRTEGTAGEKLDYAISGSYLDNGEPVEGSSFVNQTVMGNAGLVLSSSMDVRTVMRYSGSDNESFPDDSGGSLFAALRDRDQREIEEMSWGLELNHEASQKWNYQIDWEIFYRHEDAFSPGVAPGVRDPFGIPVNSADNYFRRYGLKWTNRFQFTEKLNSSIGLQGLYEDGSSRGRIELGGPATPTQFDLQRKILAPFFEFQYSPYSDLALHAGVRVDIPEEFKSEVSPRIGAVYNIKSTGTALKVNWGEGFKLPSFFSLGNSIVGNPGLLPETNWSVDAGIVQLFWNNRGSLSATYFHSTFSNAIDFDEGPPPKLVNRSEIVAGGVEMGVNIKPSSKLRLAGHLTYLETKILGTSEELRNRPKWRGGLSLIWNIKPALIMNLDSVTVGEVFDSSVPTGDVTLDAYTRLDLAVTWEPKPTWRVFLAVDNFLNEDYQEFVGFPAPGITPRVGLRKTFGL